ncbi:MAG: response regulator [Vicinamibacterales bacterium]
MLTDLPATAGTSTAPATRRVQTIMVCDDDIAVRFALKRLFTMELAAEVSEAENGLAALKALRTQVPDLLVLDLHMPFVNGVETLAAIRSTPSLATLAVIVLTGECDADVVRRVIELGVTDYLSKPLSKTGTRERLKRIIASLQVDSRNNAPRREAGDGPVLLAGSKLLVADPSEDFRYFMRTTFGSRFRVIEAASGVDALDAVIQAKPNAVMIGRDLAQLDSDQLARKIRSLRVRPDLVLLAVGTRTELESVKASGIYDACIPRTFVPEVFIREFDALGPASLPLAQLMELCPSLRAQMVSAAEQVFGMMLKMDVEPRDRLVVPFTPPYIVAKIPIDVTDTVAAQVHLVADLSSADAFAVAMFGVPEAGEGMAELSNIVAGRVKHAMVSDGLSAVLGLPNVTVVDTGTPDVRPSDSLGVRFGVTGAEHELEIRLTASTRQGSDAKTSSASPSGREGLS